jgi:hypothetical protein
MKRTIYLLSILCAFISCTDKNMLSPENISETPEKVILYVEIPSDLVASETVTLTQMSLLGTTVSF